MKPALRQATFDKLWSAALGHWDDPGAHKLFLDFAAEHHLLAEAAERYRQIEAEHDVAPHLEAIRLRAMTLLGKPSAPPKVTRAALAAWAAIGVVLVIFWAIIFRS